MTTFKPSKDWDWDQDYRVATLEQVTDHGVYRAKIERDEYPEQPENDGGYPVVRIDTNRGYSFKPEMTGYGNGYDDGLSRPADEILAYFHERTGDSRGAIDMFERYLRIFHDGNLSEYGPNQGTDYHYVAFATRTLWESWGNDGEVGKAELDEYRYWIEGDVYGVDVEKAVSFDSDDEPDVWESVGEVECWGFFGEDYAKQTAQDELTAEIKAVAATMLPLVTA